MDPENFMAQERAEARDARVFGRRDPLTGLFDAPEREHRNVFTGEEHLLPSRAEAERDEAECGGSR